MLEVLGGTDAAGVELAGALVAGLPNRLGAVVVGLAWLLVAGVLNKFGAFVVVDGAEVEAVGVKLNIGLGAVAVEVDVAGALLSEVAGFDAFDPPKIFVLLEGVVGLAANILLDGPPAVLPPNKLRGWEVAG
jgi:hypothetical protein